MNSKRIFELIGMAFVAKKIVWGELSCIDAIKKRMACAVLTAVDVGDNTLKKVNHFSQMYNVPILRFGTKYELGCCMGKEIVGVVAITDENLADKLVGLIENVGGVDSSGKNSCL